MSHKVGRVVRLGIMGALLFMVLAVSSFTAHAQERTSPVKQMYNAPVYLKHAPSGFARLRWNAQTTVLTVTIRLNGLQAMTHHPAHVHTGACPSDGSIIYALNDVVADAAGNGSSVTTIPNVKGGIPAAGWHINVHSGPTLNTPAQALPITCGDVLNPLKAAYTVVTLGPVTNADNQNASGVAMLSLSNGTLTVTAAVYNLVPGSSHAFHIHSGSCEYQLPGTILYTLTTLTANDRGFASSKTVITGVKAIPVTGWYLNVHFSTDLTTQTGYDVIACGNVR